jgi:hypothetical protein
MRRQIPLLITGFLGAIYIVTYFIPATRFVETVATDWILIIQAFAIWLGALNLLKLSLMKLASRKQGSLYAAIVVVAFFVTAAAGLAPMQSSGPFLSDHNYLAPGSIFEWIYNSMYVPLNATMFALLAFFVASASYRAFRARNREATLLLASACVLMLGRVPLGDAITGFLPEGWTMSAWADVIMNFPQLAGQRAIMIGISLGIVSTALRLVLGIERSHIGGD